MYYVPYIWRRFFENAPKLVMRLRCIPKSLEQVVSCNFHLEGESGISLYTNALTSSVCSNSERAFRDSENFLTGSGYGQRLFRKRICTRPTEAQSAISSEAEICWHFLVGQSSGHESKVEISQPTLVAAAVVIIVDTGGTNAR